jgi:type VI secretion system protein
MTLEHQHSPLQLLRGEEPGGGKGVPFLVEAVRKNLLVLLNARQGTVPHLPDYGLPELSRVFANEPECIEYLRKSIHAAVRRYEPRLTEVRVRCVEDPSAHNDLGIVFRIDGVLRFPEGSPVAYQTAFRDIQEAEVRSVAGAVP